MLRRIRDLQGWTIEAAGGEDVGSVEDFYFDEQHWTVRYVVADTGNWLVGRRVLVSPLSVQSIDWNRSRIPVNLTRDQVKNAPSADLTQPVSRRYESMYSAYYRYPPYWTGPGVWGPVATPTLLRETSTEAATDAAAQDQDASRLRSVREVTGYHIQALDGEIGHVEDFLVDQDSWRIRYLMIDTSNWIGGRTVLVAPEWARRIDWATQQVHLDMSRQRVKDSPEYDPGMDIDRAYEERLHAHYTEQSTRAADRSKS